MRAADLDLRELLQTDPCGHIRFAGQRALILDTTALGLLRKELIETVGIAVARGILTRLGFAHGWRTAEALKELPWDSERDFLTAGARIHTLQGQVIVQGRPDSPDFAEAVWKDSYEAEQHLLHVGRADEPVCWTLVGFASGYMTFAHKRRIICLEQQCRGKGDAVCRVVGKPVEEWGPEIDADLPYYEKGCMNEALQRLADELKQTERKLRVQRRALTLAGAPPEDPSGIIAQSESMRRVLELARKAAAVEASVLVTGESGVGKERVARLIHDASARAQGAFVAVNCGAVTETLLESELFGHVRGAFTGATQDRPGLFEAASGGTLFLDEVGELPPPMQVKLLRAVQEGEVRRVGENKSRKVDVRLVAATNRDLAAEVEAGRFRRDLYYRLRVIELRIPPLRERKDDILPLARAVLAASAARSKRKAASLTPAAADQLLRHAWPGNVRELQNALESALALGTGDRIDSEDLPEEIRAARGAVPSNGQSLADLERSAILAALEETNGNRERAAGQLGIGVATLYRKLQQYRSPPPAPARPRLKVVRKRR
jgi:DNA-binding NtrC family response regulator